MTTDELILSHLGYATTVAEIYSARRRLYGPEAEDVRSAAYLGLVQAAQSFDPGRGLKFVTLAQKRIHGAIIDGFRQERRKRKYEGVVFTFCSERKALNVPAVQNENDDDMLMAAVRRAALPPRLRYILNRWLAGDSHLAISIDLGICETRVGQLRQRAIGKLRAALVGPLGVEPRS